MLSCLDRQYRSAPLLRREEQSWQMMLGFLQRYVICGCDSVLRVECLCCQQPTDESLRDAAAYPITGCTHWLPRRLKGKRKSGQTVFSVFLSHSQAFNLLASSYKRYTTCCCCQPTSFAITYTACTSRMRRVCCGLKTIPAVLLL